MSKNYFFIVKHVIPISTDPFSESTAKCFKSIFFHMHTSAKESCKVAEDGR